MRHMDLRADGIAADVAVKISRKTRMRFSGRLYVIILYGYWTRVEARCRRPAGPDAGDLLLQLLEEQD
jgi:hypothetical protein